MKIICEIFQKTIQNLSSPLHGRCFENIKNSNPTASSGKGLNTLLKNLNNFTSFNIENLHKPIQATTDLNNSTTALLESKNHENAAMYIIVVLCFYSISLVCLVVFNIKFNVIFRKSFGKFFLNKV